MLSCKKATMLIEKKKFVKLKKIESIQLFFHKTMCKPCSRYDNQSNIIDDILKANYSDSDQQHSIVVSDDFEKRIIDKLH